MEDFSQVEKILSYVFKDKALMVRAFTHSSYANDNFGNSHLSNERLEFIGDAILDLVVGEELFRRFPDQPEGFLSKLRAEIVCEDALSSVAIGKGLNEYLRLGTGLNNSNGKNFTSVTGDLVEAVLGAVYFDGGYEAAFRVAHRLMDEIIELGCSDKLTRDYKSELQEYCQSHAQGQVSYELAGRTGPDHNPSFTVNVLVKGSILGSGSGKSKKEAQINAAKKALECVRKF